MRLIFVFILGFICFFDIKAQNIKVSPDVFDFGKIEKWNNEPAAFVFENKSNRPLYFLPTKNEIDLLIDYPDRAIQPGESYTLNVYYYTQKLGAFNRSIDVYTNINQSPVNLVVKGEIQQIGVNALTQCPRFIGEENSGITAFKQIFTLIDLQQNLPVSDITIKLSSSKNEVRTPKSDVLGNTTVKMNLGLYKVEIQKPGFLPFDTIMYLNRNSGPQTLWINSIPEPISLISTNTNPIPVADSLPKITFATKKIEKAIGPEMVNGELSKDRFKPNNLVLLLDVSGSMKDANKLVVLKKSIKELISVLREDDQLTVLAYTTKIRVVIPTTKVENKAALLIAIDTVRAGGLTYGAECLAEALSLLSSLEKPEANNQVILATDGMFDFRQLKEKDLYLLVKNNSLANRKLSVLGFGTDQTASKFLGKLALEGKGRFYHVSEKTNIENLLIEEVKQQSLKF